MPVVWVARFVLNSLNYFIVSGTLIRTNPYYNNTIICIVLQSTKFDILAMTKNIINVLLVYTKSYTFYVWKKMKLHFFNNHILSAIK